MRRAAMVSLALVAVLLPAALLLSAQHASATGPRSTKAASKPHQRAGARTAAAAEAAAVVDGILDVAVGVPGEDVGTKADAGAVEILLPVFQTPTTAMLPLTQGGNVEAGDRFGGSIASGDFNGDGFLDVAVGAPGEDVGAKADAGAVNVFLGNENGLPTSPNQTLTQGGSAEAGDRFGSTLATGFFNGDESRWDLAVGAPGEDVGAVKDAGAVNVFLGNAAGLPTSPNQTLTQGGNTEAGDQFGSKLVRGIFNSAGPDSLAVGAPGEDVGAKADAGAVNVLLATATGLPTSPSQTLTQGGDAEAGDRFGTALAAGVLGHGEASPVAEDLAAGAPGEDVGTVADAGAVNVFYQNAAGTGLETTNQTLTQAQGGNVEAGDQFGASLDAGFFRTEINPDVVQQEDLVVGAPGENVNTVADAGAVNVFAGGPDGLPSASTVLTQGGNVEGGDRFGSSVSASLHDSDSIEDLAVGAPSEDVGTVRDAGAVNTFRGGAGGLAASGTFTQRNPGSGAPEAGDAYGTVSGIFFGL